MRKRPHRRNPVSVWTSRISRNSGATPQIWQEKTPNQIERVKYMTGELTKSRDRGQREPVLPEKKDSPQRPGRMRPAVHPHSVGEVRRYTRRRQRLAKYITGGGSLFLVMDQDMWSTLEQTSVNDLIRPFGVQFGGESPDMEAGGHTSPGPVTNTRLKISYHGARTVTGGTPFASTTGPTPLPLAPSRRWRTAENHRDGRRHGLACT